jgi:hypothetical protein
VAAYKVAMVLVAEAELCADGRAVVAAHLASVLLWRGGCWSTLVLAAGRAAVAADLTAAYTQRWEKGRKSVTV